MNQKQKQRKRANFKVCIGPREGGWRAEHPSPALWGAQLGSRHGPEQKLPGVGSGLEGQNAQLQPSCPPLGLDSLGILCVYLCNTPDRTEM